MIKLVFPEPLSPTIEIVSFFFVIKSILFKTFMVSLPVWYLRFTFFNLRRVFMNKSFIIKIIVICLVTIKVYAIEKVVLFGDSLMAGYGLSNEHHLSVVLQKSLIDEDFNIKVINGSVSGSTSSGGLNRAEWTLSESDIDLMILGLGANDMLRGINPKETKKNLEQIIKIAQEKSIEVVLAGMIAPTSHGFKYKKNFDKIYPDLSKKYKLTLIPFLLEGVALKPKYNLSDGIHPNEKGTIIISNTLKKVILNKL
jgi:acyl-CoA thioesterase-1